MTWTMIKWCFTGCTHGDIRLVDGGSQHEGRVEVCVHNRWYTVCGFGFDIMEAIVICRQLGYSTTSVLISVKNGLFHVTNYIGYTLTHSEMCCYLICVTAVLCYCN